MNMQQRIAFMECGSKLQPWKLTEGGSKETVLKLAIARAFSPCFLLQIFSWGVAQAGIEHAFGAHQPDFKTVKAPKARTISA
jgi:hypothetical protein